MSNKAQSCLSPDVLEQIGRNEVSPDQLQAMEAHVSECVHCRDLFDSHYTTPQWSELIQPALSESGTILSSPVDHEVDQAAAILKLLGPTDEPNMLGRIGNYEIVGVIGQGGMGAVFKGFDRSLNRFVAIKILLPHLAASGAARKRFAREGQAVAAVVDDHVMAIHCVDQWQGIPYLVMTYSRGVSLQKRLNDHGRLGVREILRIGLQAAKGLAAAHAQGIVHRDIKPSNILLDQNVERVQLVDFGLARAVDDASLTCSGTLAGTPQYMSPEQARAEVVDHRSDLFSLGSVLYAMCVGHAPFRADSSYSVLHLIIDKEPRPIRELNAEIPDWLCAIISKLMAKRAVDRFDSARQVAELLEACLAHVQQPTVVPLPPGVTDLLTLGRLASKIIPTQNGPRPLSPTFARRFINPPIGKYVAVAGFAFALVFAGVLVVLELNKGTLTIQSQADNVPIRIKQGDKIVDELTVSQAGKTMRVAAGKYLVEIDGDMDGIEIVSGQVLLKRSGVETVKIVKSDQASDGKGTLKLGGGATAAQGGISSDVQITVDEDTGLMIIKGPKEDVQRTIDVIDRIRKADPAAASGASPLPGQASDNTKLEVGSDTPVAVLMVMHPAELRNGNTIQRAAATKTLELLAGNDYCGILAYGKNKSGYGPKWLWGEESGLLQVGDHRHAWNETIAKSMAGDFPDFEPAFQMALDALKEVNATRKLMIVFTDGDPIFMDESFLDKFRDAHIKVSVVQVDIHLIHQNSLLKRLVESTGGTYHYALASQANAVENFFIKEVQKLREDESQQLESAFNQIGLAFHTIHAKTGKFPGSRIRYVDRQQKEFEHPFSWRVAILPYIGHQQLYDEYRFDEAWDSDTNMTLLKKMPDVYRSPYAPASQPIGHSNMLGFASEAGGLGIDSGQSLNSFTDGAHRTILIVETAHNVPWTKPEDLTGLTVEPMAGQPLRFVLADGSTGAMNPIDTNTLEKMITRNGGEADNQPSPTAP